MQEEIWKAIEGYEGLYEVSNFGRVRSVARKETKGCVLRFGENRKNGYLQVKLYKDRKGKSIKVHRLVAQTFIPNPDNLPQLNHIDEDKTNNRVENLEWCTASYNHDYGTRKERVSKANAQNLSHNIL